MARGIIRYQIESVRNLAFVFEDVSPAASHYSVWKLRLAPANVQGRHHVIKQIGRDSTGVIPVLSESEKSIGVICPFRRVSEPRLPINEIFAFAIGSRLRIDPPIPLAAGRVSLIRALAHQQLA